MIWNMTAHAGSLKLERQRHKKVLLQAVSNIQQEDCSGKPEHPQDLKGDCTQYMQKGYIFFFLFCLVLRKVYSDHIIIDNGL